MATIADFLKSIGMAEYAAGLSESGIDDSALQGLTERDLERLGVAPADRTRLLRAIAGFHPDRKPAPPADKRLDHGVERRHLTILFGDLVGSTAISTRLDPEALHEIMGAYRRCCAEVIEQGRGLCRQIPGRWRIGLFRLSAGERGRGGARGQRRARAGRVRGSASRRHGKAAADQGRHRERSCPHRRPGRRGSAAQPRRGRRNAQPRCAASGQRRAGLRHHQRRDASARRRAFRVRGRRRTASQGLRNADGIVAGRQAERNRQPLSGAALGGHAARRSKAGERSHGSAAGRPPKRETAASC